MTTTNEKKTSMFLFSEINVCSNSSAYDSSEDTAMGTLSETEYIPVASHELGRLFFFAALCNTKNNIFILLIYFIEKYLLSILPICYRSGGWTCTTGRHIGSCCAQPDS